LVEGHLEAACGYQILFARLVSAALTVLIKLNMVVAPAALPPARKPRTSAFQCQRVQCKGNQTIHTWVVHTLDRQTARSSKAAGESVKEGWAFGACFANVSGTCGATSEDDSDGSAGGAVSQLVESVAVVLTFGQRALLKALSVLINREVTVEKIGDRKAGTFRRYRCWCRERGAHESGEREESLCDLHIVTIEF
jgi:hypothetical protein